MNEEKCNRCPAYNVCFQMNSDIKIESEECIGLYYYNKGYEAAKNNTEKDALTRDKEIEQWIKLKAWANDSDAIQTLTRVGYNRGLEDIQKILDDLFYEARSMYDDIDDMLFYIKYRLPDIFKRKQKTL